MKCTKFTMCNFPQPAVFMTITSGLKYNKSSVQFHRNYKTRVPRLRTFTLIVFAHPDCARSSFRNVTPRHAWSARTEKTVQTNIGLVAVAITSLAIYSLKWSVIPNFF